MYTYVLIHISVISGIVANTGDTLCIHISYTRCTRASSQTSYVFDIYTMYLQQAASSQIHVGESIVNELIERTMT
jgi:hypothetical protein